MGITDFTSQPKEYSFLTALSLINCGPLLPALLLAGFFTASPLQVGFASFIDTQKHFAA